MTLLTDHLRAMAGAFGNEVAYTVVDGGEMTFAQWDGESNRLARSLTGHGIERGDRVAIYMPAEEALRWVIGYSAVHKAGGVAVPTNIRLAVPELVHQLAHAEVKVLLCDATLEPVAREAVHAMTKEGSASSAPLMTEPLIKVAPGGDPPFSWGDGADPDASPYQVPVGPDDLADILYTSGTTGRPKGVAIRHRNAALIPGGPNPSFSGKRWLHASPMFTFAGIGFIYNPMQLGLCGVYQPKFDAGRWLRAVEELQPTMCFIVPSMAQLIVAHPTFATADLASIQLCAIGSAPLAPATLVAMQERMPEAAVSNSYGMTEAGPAFCAMPKGESLRRIGSVGQPMPPLEVRFVDDDGEELERGEVGEVAIRLEGRQREYYRDPEATAGTWKDGWLHTGDLGRMDEDGYLYIVGRKKDVIIRGGNNIHAMDVEAVLHDHPGVLEAAVVGMPHKVLGEDVAAFVVLKADSDATPDELRDHTAARLADYKVPRYIEIVDELPRNATGKVLKPQLRARFAENEQG
jgi:acyl-CoA synthetase (AMP-forming)/AMP-acid ligase II